MPRIAVFPGSFDPITIGHESVIRRAVPLFDEVIVAIGINANKKYFFDLDRRKTMIEQTFADEPAVRVETFGGLTVDFCREMNAQFILRGLRTAADFEFERAIGQMNRAMDDGIETLFLLTLPEHAAINSTIVRDIIRHGGDASPFVPTAISL